jgi:cytoskeletal protein CcmA (bactofilin family)
MFGKTKDAADTERSAQPARPNERPVAPPRREAPDSPDSVSSLSSGMSIVGKIVSNGTVKIFGRVEGELQAVHLVISDGAQVEGDVVAEDLTIGGRVKGTIHAGRVRLDGTAVVEGDIFHRSLSVEENARFEGTSRREESAIDTPHIPLGQTALPAAPGHAGSDASRKLNGDLDKETHATAATA